MALVTLLFGSNLGDRELLMNFATQAMENIGRRVLTSSMYDAEPWGFSADTHFLNQAVVYNTAFSPRDVLQEAFCVENTLKRERPKLNSGYASRTMDIDILFYDDLVMDSSDLTLPHPRIPLRRFVLVPLAEILPDFVHPVLGLTMKRLLEECTDPLAVTPFRG